MTVFLDIGATLVTGPDEGPAKRLARELGLDADTKARIGAAMMTQHWTQAEEFLSWLETELGGQWTREPHRGAALSLWDAQMREVSAIDGAPAVFSGLLDAGLSVGLISNIWRPYFEGARRAFDGLFERAAGTAPQALSYRVGAAKPDAAIYASALAACGREPAHTVMVGDTYETDIAPALALGMGTIWILHRPEAERDALARVRSGEFPLPDLVLHSITELTPELVREVQRRKPAALRAPA